MRTNKDETQFGPDVWVVRGQATDENGQGIAGPIVGVYDKDIVSYDQLGTALKNTNGDITITYLTKDFCDVFEVQPELSQSLCILRNHGTFQKRLSDTVCGTSRFSI